MTGEKAKLTFAIVLHRHGRLVEAEAVYREILSQVPCHFDALHNLGVLCLQRGQHDLALVLFERALPINPTSATLHLNIGNALRSLKRSEAALQSYERALALKGDFAEAHNNRATVLRDLGRNEEAIESADRALAIKPDYLEAHLNRGHAANTLDRCGEAVASYRKAMACGGNMEELRYYLAALGAETLPSESPPSYIENLFDNYADGFDRSLLSLGYKIPEQLFEAIVSVRGGGSGDVVDLGCGTGMCGPFLRTIARTLVGVDLSAKMLEKATGRSVYDQLIKAEIVNFLRRSTGPWDLIVAADVFIYLGDLDPVFAAAKAALRSGGHLSFSVEAHNGVGFVIRPSRRFAHSSTHLRQLAARHGFIVRASTGTVVRMEQGQEVEGLILVLERG